MLRTAVETVQRNIRGLLLYVIITTVYFTMKLAIENRYEHLVGVDADGAQVSIYLVVSTLITAVVYAIAQSMAFSTFGREIEKPFWKISNHQEAIVRFFPLWLLLNLTNLLFLNSIPIISSGTGSINSWLILWLIFSSTITPIGATIMFYGKCGKEEIESALSTFGHQIPRFFLICFFAFIVNNLLIGLVAGIPIYGKPFLVIIEGYFECVIFVYSWYICRNHREMLEQSDDDFDF
jgi:hypothetical protein